MDKKWMSYACLKFDMSKCFCSDLLIHGLLGLDIDWSVIYIERAFCWCMHLKILENFLNTAPPSSRRRWWKPPLAIRVSLCAIRVSLCVIRVSLCAIRVSLSHHWPYAYHCAPYAYHLQHVFKLKSILFFPPISICIVFQTSKIHKFFIFCPNSMRLFALFSLWCVVFYGDF